MADVEETVYLEDIEPAKATKGADADVTAATSSAPSSPAASQDQSESSMKVQSKEAPAPSTSGGGVKRQRTLLDMMGGKSASSSVGPAPKKTKLASEGSSTSLVSTSAGGGKTLNSIPFSQSEFEASLSEEEKQLLELEYVTMGKSWLKVLKDEIRKPYFLALKRFLLAEGLTGLDANCQIYPPPRQIYSWSTHTPLGKVKVVIIGQDPYHGPGQAHGLCFSVLPGVAVPPSLKNIYAEIKSEYPSFTPPRHGDLTSWADQGVLLLNTFLTVRPGKAGSHGKQGWESFTDKVVDAVDKHGGANLGAKTGTGRGVVFLCWGAWAAKRTEKLNKSKHLILKSAHPSPLSAHKGFLGNGHFRKANDWLEAKYGPDACVDWCRL